MFAKGRLYSCHYLLLHISVREWQVMKIYLNRHRVFMNIFTGILVTLFMWATLAIVQKEGRQDSSKERVVTFNSELAPRLGILASNSLRIVSVDAGSVAERAGLQCGDILRKIGQVSLPTTVLIPAPSGDSAVPLTSIISPNSSLAVMTTFHKLAPTWERSVSITVERGGVLTTLQVLVTAKVYRPDPTAPTPAPATAVPSELWPSTFYF